MNKKNIKGLILAEALLAIAMLSIGTLVLATIMRNSITGTALTKNFLIAQNLATEAIESVKSVRDTNWLKQDNKTDCWLELEPDMNGICPSTIEWGLNYVPLIGTQWTLAEVPGEFLDLENGADEDYRVWIDDSVPEYDRFMNNGYSDESIFYRGIQNVYIFSQLATFNVKVEWFEGTEVHSLERSFILFNYAQ